MPPALPLAPPAPRGPVAPAAPPVHPSGGWRPALRREGAGARGTLAGFRSRREAVGGGPATTLVVHVVRQGPFVIEFSGYGLAALDVEAVGRTLDLAARILRSSPATASAVSLRARVRSFLPARAIGRVAVG